MDKLIFIVFVELLWTLLPGVSFGASQLAPLTPTQKTMSHTLPVNPGYPDKKLMPSVLPKQIPVYQLYTYYGDRYRDPFIPLVGAVNADLTSDRPPQISSLLLKGIMQDAKGRMALLTSGISSYILRGGRLYDGRNHMMKGISGVIKSNSVILIGSDHTVRELHVSVTL